MTAAGTTLIAQQRLNSESLEYFMNADSSVFGKVQNVPTGNGNGQACMSVCFPTADYMKKTRVMISSPTENGLHYTALLHAPLPKSAQFYATNAFLLRS